MYADELTRLFIKQELQGHYISEEWNLLDIVAIQFHKSYDPFSPLKIKLYEVKSNHDNVYRVFDQLPSYVWIADEVGLILGEKQKIPKRLPVWLNIIQFNGETFDHVYVADDKSWSYNHTFSSRKAIYVAEYALPEKKRVGSDSPSWHFFTTFMKKWYANSVLNQDKKKKIIPYTNAEKALIYYLAEVKKLERKSFKHVETAQNVYSTEEIPITDEQIKKLMVRPLDRFMLQRSLLMSQGEKE